MEEKIEKFLQYIEQSDNIVFFGGAGVSTESGIPDFRSKNGLYNQHDIQFENYSPEYLLSHDCLYDNPEVFYEFYRQKMDTRTIEPNVTHYALAELERRGKLKAIVTQNIDGLHQKAGSKHVYEIHGTTQKNYCSKCQKEFSPDYIFCSNEKVPRCTCGGFVRPYVTLYGENLPDDAVEHAVSAIKHADMLIVAGTSLQVYPAAGFIYGFQGKHMAVINKEKLKISINEENDVFLCESMGTVFRHLA
uniref:NAD-dependent protein deacylase n=1 Tax=Agathobacter sp. TaxID=2021311 RepID=UPI004055FD44